jgi:hypothetical protein
VISLSPAERGLCSDEIFFWYRDEPFGPQQLQQDIASSIRAHAGIYSCAIEEHSINRANHRAIFKSCQYGSMRQHYESIVVVQRAQLSHPSVLDEPRRLAVHQQTRDAPRTCQRVPRFVEQRKQISGEQLFFPHSTSAIDHNHLTYDG